MSEAPILSVVVPSWNTRELLATCLSCVADAEKPRTEVIVVDNGSEDGSAEMVAERFPEVRLIRNEGNEGFARACNQGMRVASGTYVLLLNSDTEVGNDALVRMLGFLEENPGYGAVAPRLIHPGGATQRTLMAFPGMWTPLFFATPFERWFPDSPELRRYFLKGWDQEDERDVDQPPAACLLLRQEVLERVGLFDERLWLFFNDVDLALRVKQAGWKTRYLAGVTVVHHVGASTSKFGDFVSEWQKNRLVYYRKHHGWFAAVWVKACVGFAFVDFAVRQGWARVRGREREPVGPVGRRFWGFLWL